jgi:hypothetical protein
MNTTEKERKTCRNMLKVRHPERKKGDALLRLFGMNCLKEGAMWHIYSMQEL